MDTDAPGWTQTVVLALIQGLTEFLPVSSSAHLILPAALLGWPDQGLAFDVAVHLGTLAAVLAYFRRDLLAIGRDALDPAAWRARRGGADLAAKLCVASVPLACAGLALKAQVEAHLRSTTVIALATIAFGVALWLADRCRRDAADGAPAAPSYAQALGIGLAQALALIPGASRSGVTIAAALVLGLSRTAAARFSFLLSIPAIGGAALLTGMALDAGAPWPQLGVGFLVAAGSAYLCVSAFIALVERVGMAPFALYRLALGAGLLLLMR